MESKIGLRYVRSFLSVVLFTGLAACKEAIPESSFFGEVQDSAILISRTSGQSDYTNSFPISYDVSFSEAIDTGTFDASDLTSSGTASGLSWTITNLGNDMDFTATVGSASEGSIIPSIAAGAVASTSGNDFASSTNSSVTVQYDITGPDLTLNQATAQADPTNSPTANFDVVFNEEIDPLSFTTSDLSSSGSAASITWGIINSGDNQNFTVTATPGTDGSIIPVIFASTVTDIAGNSNSASSSTDNIVSIDFTSPTVSQVLSLNAGGTYTNGNTLTIDVLFNEAVFVSGTPQLQLETGTVDQLIDYTSGSGTATISFSYTVSSADISTDLDYISSTALTNGGGSLVDSVGNTANLTLPTPGTTFSLGDNESFVIVGTPATLSISESDPYNYGTLAIGGNSNHIFTITNTGGYPASGLGDSTLAAPFAYVGGTFPGTGGNCGVTLSAGASCNIAVSFSPIGAGPAGDSISVSYNNGISGGHTAARDLIGTGVTPATLTVSEADPYDFGTLVVGDSTSHIFIVTNTGGYQASNMGDSSLVSPFTYVGGSWPGTGGDCGSTLNAGATCNIEVSFAPVGTGLVGDSITVTYDNGASAGLTSLRDVQGTGTMPALITISESDPYDYGNLAVGGDTDHIFTLTNTGGFQALNISAGSFGTSFSFTGGTFPGSGGDCGTTLNAGGSCNIVVNYAPVGTGLVGDTINITYDDGLSTGLSSIRNIQGTGVTPAVLSISEADPYDYGNIIVAGNITHSFTVTNSGGHQATNMVEGALSSSYSFAGGAWPGSGGDCGSTLNAGANCTIVVEFSPVGIGLASDTITITYDDGASTGLVSTRDIQGTGASPALITITEADPYDYGTVAINSIPSHIFTISNTGGVTATSITETGLGLPYSIVGGTCTLPQSLDSGNFCTIEVQFNPTASGTYNDTIDIAYNDGSSPTNTTRDVTGIEAPNDPADITKAQCYTLAYSGEPYECRPVAEGISDLGDSTVPWILQNNTCGGWLSINPTTGVASGTPPSTFNGDKCSFEIVADDGVYSATLPWLVKLTILGDTDITQVDSGIYHSCAVQDGRAKCWGDGTYGAIGNNNTSSQFIPQIVLNGSLSDLTNVTQVSSGFDFSCARHVGGGLSCWGENVNGTLGDGTNTSSTVAVDVTGITDAVKVVAGTYSSCALVKNASPSLDGQVQCWGLDDDGLLGDGSGFVASNTPVSVFDAITVSPLVGAIDVDVGETHACALMNDRSIKCWGLNDYGQLGQEDTSSDHSATTVIGFGEGLLEPAALVVSSFKSNCALLTNDNIKCWGENSYGQLGLGSITNIGDNPGEMGSLADVSLGGPAKLISAGTYHTCAITDTNTLRCWGSNDYGELGQGNLDVIGDDEAVNSVSPIDLGTGVVPLDVTGGWNLTCARVDASGTIEVRCWGDNTEHAAGGVTNGGAFGDDPGEMGDFLTPLSF